MNKRSPIAQDFPSINCVTTLHRVMRYSCTLFSCAILLQSSRFKVPQGGREADRVGNIWCPGFKFPWQLVVGGSAEADAIDHIPAACHGGKRSRAPSCEKRAYSCWPTTFMCAYSVKSACRFFTFTSICGAACAPSITEYARSLWPER